MRELKHLSDYTEIYEVLKLCGSDLYNQSINNEAALAKLSDKFSKYGNFVTANLNSKLVGFAAFYCNDERNRTGFLSMIVIRKEYQNSGFGGELLNHVANVCKMNGMSFLKLEVAAENINAQKFYLKHGFYLSETGNEGALYYECRL